jgi:hypothetical protein
VAAVLLVIALAETYLRTMRERAKLAVIALIAALCAGATFGFDYEFLTVVFVLESVVATMLALL